MTLINPNLNLRTDVTFTDKWNATNTVTIDGEDSVTVKEVDKNTGEAILTSKPVSVKEFVTSERFSNIGTRAQRLQMLQRSTQRGEETQYTRSKDYAPPLPISKNLQDYVNKIGSGKNSGGPKATEQVASNAAKDEELQKKAPTIRKGYDVDTNSEFNLPPETLPRGSMVVWNNDRGGTEGVGKLGSIYRKNGKLVANVSVFDKREGSSLNFKTVEVPLEKISKFYGAVNDDLGRIIQKDDK